MGVRRRLVNRCSIGPSLGVGVLVAFTWRVGAGCSGPEQPATPDTTSAATESGPTCEGLRQDGCAIAGGYRYFVAGNAAADSAVVIDLGGPGLALGSTALLDDFVAALPQALVEEHRFLAFEEPWAYQPDATPECADAAGDWLRASRDALSHSVEDVLLAAPSSLREACGPELRRSGWSPSTYREAVAAALDDQGVPLAGFIGASFGGARRLYLDDGLAPTWTILVDPAPPGGSLAELLRDRSDAARQALVVYCPTCTDERIEAAAAALDANPVALEGRSFPVSGADLKSAIAVGAKQPPQIQQGLAAAVSGTPLTTETLRTVAQTSDAAWGRFGTDGVAPSSLAYFSEVCAAYPGDPTYEPDASSASIASTLATLHSPCIGADAGGLPSPAVQALCIVAHTGDIIAGPATQRWLHAYPDASAHELPPGPHGSPDLTGCWKEQT